MSKKEIAKINSGEKILGNLDASNLLLLNVHYSGKRKDIPDVCTVILKDVTTGEKKKMEIENPLMNIYVVKEDYRDMSFYPEFMDKDKCDIHLIQYNKLLSYIAKIAPDDWRNYAKSCIESKNYYALKNLHHVPYVLASDFPYENYFRIEWMLNYANPNINTKITKQYLDIEVDTIDIKGMPDGGDCPINAVTIVDEELKTSFTFLLRNPENPQIAEFEEDIKGFIDECHEAFDDFYGELAYKIFMYDNELDLIRDVFKLINSLKRDFCLIWNLSFDIPYFIERLKYLNQNVEDYMCSPDFDFKYCYFIKDNRNFDFKKKKDKFRIASYTTFSDQMINYAKVRKGQAELPSLKLTSVAQSEIKDEKLDYSDEANIKTLPYVNYRKFVRYNIKD